MVEKVEYEIREKHLGLHRVRGVKIEGEKGFWNFSQAQWVNNHWEPAGCNWYTDDQILEILENEAEIIKTGSGYLKELDDPELERKVVLVVEDEFGNEYFIF